MKLSKFNKLCKKWEVNPSAMREKLQEITLTSNLKEVNKQVFISCLYLNAPSLFYCKDGGDGVIEYQDRELIKKLINATNKLRGA